MNVYLPGYLKTGISGTLQHVGTSIKAKFSDTNDQVIDAYVEVRPEVIAALGKLVKNGAGTAPPAPTRPGRWAFCADARRFRI